MVEEVDRRLVDQEVERLRVRLVDTRKERKVSQERIAKRLGISREAFVQMEQPGSDMKLTTLLRWTEALNVDLIMIDKKARSGAA